MRILRMQEVASWQQLEQLENEAAVLKQLNHSGIPACLESDEDLETFCMVQVCNLYNPTSFSHGSQLNHHATIASPACYMVPNCHCIYASIATEQFMGWALLHSSLVGVWWSQQLH